MYSSVHCVHLYFLAFIHSSVLGTLAYSSLSQSQLCVFSEYTLNGAQFVQLIDTFLNMSTDLTLFNQLLSYIKEGYVMAEDEKTLKIMKVFNFLTILLKMHA